MLLFWQAGSSAKQATLLVVAVATFSATANATYSASVTYPAVATFAAAGESDRYANGTLVVPAVGTVSMVAGRLRTGEVTFVSGRVTPTKGQAYPNVQNN